MPREDSPVQDAPSGYSYSGNTLVANSVASGPGYGGGGKPITLGASNSVGAGPAANIGYGSPGSSISLGSGSGGSNALVSRSITGAGDTNAMRGSSGGGSPGIVTVSSSSPAAQSLLTAPSMDLSSPAGMMAAAPMTTMPPTGPVVRVGSGVDPANVEERMLVMNVQQGLVDKGANIKVDGIFGSRTKAALGAWKRANGVKGWAGFADEEVIRRLTGPAPDPTGTLPKPPAAPLIPAPGKPPGQQDTPVPATPVPPEKPTPGDVVPIPPNDPNAVKKLGENLPPDEQAEIERILRESERAPPGFTIDTPGEHRAFVYAHNAPPPVAKVNIPEGSPDPAEGFPDTVVPAVPVSRPARAPGSLIGEDPTRVGISNALVEATVPYGEGVRPVEEGVLAGLPPRTERMEPSVAPREPTVETVKPVVQKEMTAADRELFDYKATVDSNVAKLVSDIARKMDPTHPKNWPAIEDSIYRTRLDKEKAAAAVKPPAAAAKPASLPPAAEETAPAPVPPSGVEGAPAGWKRLLGAKSLEEALEVIRGVPEGTPAPAPVPEPAPPAEVVVTPGGGAPVKEAPAAPKAPTPGALNKEPIAAEEAIRVVGERDPDHPDITPEIAADIQRYYETLSGPAKKQIQEKGGLTEHYFAHQKEWEEYKAGLGEKPAKRDLKTRGPSPSSKGEGAFRPRPATEGDLDPPAPKAPKASGGGRKQRRSDIEGGGEQAVIAGYEGEDALEDMTSGRAMGRVSIPSDLAASGPIAVAAAAELAGDFPADKYGGGIRPEHGGELPYQGEESKIWFPGQINKFGDTSGHRWWSHQEFLDEGKRQGAPPETSEDLFQRLLQDQREEPGKQPGYEQETPTSQRETRGVQVAGAGDVRAREMPAFSGSVNAGRQPGGVYVERDSDRSMYANGQRDIEPRGRDDMFHLLPTRHETTPARRPVGFVYNAIPPNTIYRAPDGTYRKKKQQEATA